MSHERPPSTLPPGSIVDTYLRDSGGERQDRSVARQLEAIQQFCAEHQLVLRHIYKDVAKSGGTTAGRENFDRMIASTREEATRPRGILLWNYARFARDLDDSTYYKALLRSKRGIVIHSLTDPIPEGQYGRFVEILIDISNEEKRRQTSIDTKDGIRSIVMQGAIPGIPPRGFKREPIITINSRTGEERKNHRWVPDPKYKARILKAFQMRSVYASLDEIRKATHLFSNTGSWTTFWKKRIYMGTLEYAGMVFENYCEAIVPRELWEKVQQVQKTFEHKGNLVTGDVNHPRRVGSSFLLSGLARCSRCGSPLYGHTSVLKSGHHYQSYFCTLAYRKRGACSKGRIPRTSFEAAVLATLKDQILKKENLDELHRRLSAQNAGLVAQQDDQRRELNSQLSHVKRQLTNVTDALADSGKSKTLLDRLSRLETQKLELETALIALDAVQAQPVDALTPEELDRRLANFHAILERGDEPSQKTLLRALIAYVDIERDDKTLRGTIYFYLPLAEPPPTSPTVDEDPDYVSSPATPSGPQG